MVDRLLVPAPSLTPLFFTLLRRSENGTGDGPQLARVRSAEETCRFPRIVCAAPRQYRPGARVSSSLGGLLGKRLQPGRDRFKIPRGGVCFLGGALLHLARGDHPHTPNLGSRKGCHGGDQNRDDENRCAHRVIVSPRLDFLSSHGAVAEQTSSTDL
ncbi:MAG: hypothetical protein AAGG01_21265, partial [Planctomycetota bacterium]